jgi:hypothetical protein
VPGIRIDLLGNSGVSSERPLVRFGLIQPIFLFELSSFLFHNRGALEKN